jgi:hypothetical protein
MPLEALETRFAAETAPYTTEWIEARLEQMKKDRLTGKLPEDRETILRRLGYPSYENYRRRVLWQRIRLRILERDSHTCRRCDETAKDVHHHAYTEAVLKGKDDSLLGSLCRNCHDKVERDERRFPRTEKEKRRVYEDREGARREKMEAEQARELDEQARVASGGRCFWCKGDTEIPMWGSGGAIYVIPTMQGDDAGVWMCSGCISVLDHDKDGRSRSDEERLTLLSKKANVRYNRRKPNTSFTFGEKFWKLNAMQREGLMNEYKWNCMTMFRSEPPDPEYLARFAEVEERYQRTKANAR